MKNSCEVEVELLSQLDKLGAPPPVSEETRRALAERYKATLDKIFEDNTMYDADLDAKRQRQYEQDKEEFGTMPYDDWYKGNTSPWMVNNVFFGDAAKHEHENEQDEKCKNGHDALRAMSSDIQILESLFNSDVAAQSIDDNAVKPYAKAFRLMIDDVIRLDTYHESVVCNRATRRLEFRLSLYNGLFIMLAMPIDGDFIKVDFSVSSDQELIIADSEPFMGIVDKLIQLEGPNKERYMDNRRDLRPTLKPSTDLDDLGFPGGAMMERSNW